MKILFIINDAPYGTEKAYNALRLGIQILKDNPGTELNIFLLAEWTVEADKILSF